MSKPTGQKWQNSPRFTANTTVGGGILLKTPGPGHYKYQTPHSRSYAFPPPAGLEARVRGRTGPGSYDPDPPGRKVDYKFRTSKRFNGPDVVPPSHVLVMADARRRARQVHLSLYIYIYIHIYLHYNTHTYAYLSISIYV